MSLGVLIFVFIGLLAACPIVGYYKGKEKSCGHYSKHARWIMLSYYGAIILNYTIVLLAGKNIPGHWLAQPFKTIGCFLSVAGPAIGYILVLMGLTSKARFGTNQCQKCGYRIDNILGDHCAECGIQWR